MTRIYFATNRRPNRAADPDDFGSNFSDDGLANLRFGRAEVSGSNFDQIQIRVASEDLLADPPVLGSQAIFEQVRQQMAQTGEDTIIFIHGFNTSFRGALSQAARLHQVLTANDPIEPTRPLRLNMCVFSWPSDGSLLLTNPRSRDAVAYKNDRLDAAASGVAFARAFLKMADFINDINQNSQPRCNQRLHLIAHSMGAYVLRAALQEVKKQVVQLPRIFDQVLLTAADEDDDAFDFDYKLFSLPRITRRTSVYFNRNDLALWASDTLKGNSPRLGTDGPMQPQQLPRNVYPIDCTDIISRITDPTEHGYFTTVPRVVTDMRQVIRNQIPDEIRGRRYIPETNRYRLLMGLDPQNR
ncbi:MULTISPECIES: alpha/beta fold hydrolase [Trichocoleus]|uniref:Alpha/beta fold hydrolase n=1 Tax=Trichocoleus desertorum GB2-A4 TaxID=2933944 RepID=A0ABV0J1E7_9CYAN|nr:alpha/beta fold hydrolase [Trichocoleus sp. FACHB-46]MBD1860215.1 alpha/beta fold hydrolase [Trichocoleus sp. FACHB-46]